MNSTKNDIQQCLDFIAEDRTYNFDESFWNEYFARKVSSEDFHYGADFYGREF